MQTRCYCRIWGVPLCRGPRSSGTGNLSVALALDLPPCSALPWLCSVVSQTPLGTGHLTCSSKDKDSQEAGTAHLAGVQACDRGAP